MKHFDAQRRGWDGKGMATGQGSVRRQTHSVGLCAFAKVTLQSSSRRIFTRTGKCLKSILCEIGHKTLKNEKNERTSVVGIEASGVMVVMTAIVVIVFQY